MSGGLSCVVPAAGFSRRFPGGNKLLERLPEGSTVVASVIAALLEAGVCSELLVVTGHQAEQVEEALRGLPVRLVRAAGHAGGMGATLAEGVRACARDCRGFLVCPADLPWLQAGTVCAVAEAFHAAGGLRHIVPFEGGRRGHPVVMAPSLRAALEKLAGDCGARELLLAEEAQGRITRLIVSDPGIHRDADRGLSRA